MNTVQTINLLEVARGAVTEQINTAVAEIMDNIQNPNTEWKPTRTLTIKINFKPNEMRDRIALTAQAKAGLAPVGPIETLLYAEVTGNGIVAAELTKPDPRQVSVDEVMGTATTNIIQMKRSAGGNG